MIYEARNAAIVIGDMSLFRAVVTAGLAPFVVLRRCADLQRHSRCFRGGAAVADWSSDPQQFVADLLELGGRFKHRPVLFTTNDGVLLVVSRHRETLAKQFRFLMPAPEMLESLVDKVGFAALAKRYGLPVPATIGSDELDDSLEALKSIAPPVVLKPSSRHYGWHSSDIVRMRGRGPQKVLRADSLSGCRSLLGEMRRVTSDFVVQRYIPGDDRQIFSYHAYFNDQSEPLVSFVGRKIRSYPRDSGMSTCLELVKDPRVASIAVNVLRKLRFVGPVKLDFKEDPRDGSLHLLEVNARCTLWNYLGAVNGVNIPLAAWIDLNGGHVACPDDYGVAVRWLSFGNDFRTFLRCYHADGDLTWRQYLSSLAQPKVYDIFAWRDPMPALFHGLGYLKRLSGRRLR